MTTTQQTPEQAAINKLVSGFVTHTLSEIAECYEEFLLCEPTDEQRQIMLEFMGNLAERVINTTVVVEDTVLP